jgi:hypothetical protein
MTSKPLPTKKNLLLCLDAFGTLFTPSIPIPIAYARAAARHGIHIPITEHPTEVGKRFKEAFKKESQENPNYGKATGMGAEKWWGNVSGVSIVTTRVKENSTRFVRYRICSLVLHKGRTAFML